MAVVSALWLTWRGRATWEPWEEDVPQGPQKVAGVLCAVVICILWFSSDSSPASFFTYLAIICAVLTVIFLVVYGYLIGVQTYTKVIVVDAARGTTEEKKVTGGFRLTADAQEAIKEHKLTVQTFFEGTAYDPDVVWTRPSRAAAKQLFVLSYIGLVACGTVALASAALLVGLRAP